jgi:hypothetical protein
LCHFRSEDGSSEDQSKLGRFARWVEVLVAWEMAIQICRNSTAAAKILVAEMGAIACVCSVLFLALLTHREQKNTWEEYSKDRKKELLYSHYFTVRISRIILMIKKLDNVKWTIRRSSEM